MRMCKKMILTVFIIAVALGAETEFKIVTVLLGTSADGTFMFGDIVHLPGLAFEGLSSVYFGRRYIFVIPSSEKENNKIEQRCCYRYCHRETVGYYLINKQYYVCYGKPFYLDRYQKHKKKLHVGIFSGKCKEYRHIYVIRTECTRYGISYAFHRGPGHITDAIKDESTYYRKEHTGKNIEIEPEGAPGTLKR